MGDLKRDRASGVTLIVCAVISAGFMVAHPSVSAGELSAAFAEARHEAPIAMFVHAVLIAVTACFVFGYSGFAQRLGLHRPSVRAGLIAYVVGAIGGVGAGVINGLVFPELATEYADRSQAEMETAHMVLRYAGRVSNVLAQMCVLGWSAALIAWSTAVVPLSGLWKWIAGLGVLIGLGFSIVLLAGQLTLDVAGFGSFVFAHGLWATLVGAKLALASD